MKDLASPAGLSASRQVLPSKLAFPSAAGCITLLVWIRHIHCVIASRQNVLRLCICTAAFLHGSLATYHAILCINLHALPVDALLS